MLRFYFNTAPNPMKVALFLYEAGLPFEAVPVDTRKGEQHAAAFLTVNPNGKLPAIVDEDGTRVFDSNAILLYLGDKTGQFVGTPADRGELLSWLMFIASGIGPYSGQSVHFQRAAPEKLPYAVNRYMREAERHYQVLEDHLAEGQTALVGGSYSIVDMAAWGWIDRAPLVLGGAGALAGFPKLQAWFTAIDARPAVAKARAIGQGHAFKQEMDEAALRAMFPSNYPKVA